VRRDRSVGDVLPAQGMTARADGMSGDRVRHYDVSPLEVGLW
jgi:hypothetical protein